MIFQPDNTGIMLANLVETLMKLLASRINKSKATAGLFLVSALLVVSSCQAYARETSDPFGTDSMLPPKPALRIEGAGWRSVRCATA